MIFIAFRHVSSLLNRNQISPQSWMFAPVIFLLILSPLLAAQESSPPASAAAPTFTVAAIKSSNPNTYGNSFRVNHHRFETRNTSLSDLISFAFALHATQITNLPAWAQSNKYDLTAQSDKNIPVNGLLWKSMLRRYLAESFQLKFHRDTQERLVYTLAISSTGPKLTQSKGDPNGLPSLSLAVDVRSPAKAILATVSATNATMADLAGIMQRLVLEWPVIDQTRIPGRYDFALNWTPDASQFADVHVKIPPTTGTASAPSDLSTALQEQLGLKLDFLSAPSEVLVIDHVERPFDK